MAVVHKRTSRDGRDIWNGHSRSPPRTPRRPEGRSGCKAEIESAIARKLSNSLLTMTMQTLTGCIDEYGSCAPPEWENTRSWRTPPIIEVVPLSEIAEEQRAKLREVEEQNNRKPVEPPTTSREKRLKPLLRVKDIIGMIDLPPIISPIHVQSSRRERSPSPPPKRRRLSDEDEKRSHHTTDRSDRSKDASSRPPSTSDSSRSSKDVQKRSHRDNRRGVDTKEEAEKIWNEARDIKHEGDTLGRNPQGTRKWIEAALKFMHSARLYEEGRYITEAVTRYDQTVQFCKGIANMLARGEDSDRSLLSVCHECVAVGIMQKMMLTDAIGSMKNNLRTLTQPAHRLLGGYTPIGTPGGNGMSPVVVTPMKTPPTSVPHASPSTTTPSHTLSSSFTDNITDMLLLFESVQAVEKYRPCRMIDIPSFILEARRDLAATPM
ncbi:hypothetical protein PROFUN_13157 [Planoprotostelium fungivorum]|uniref:Uncharacterized protein n=1 Tax=Planoprotostelium fungivorum TaxID=1890364 RepID=A0A2P6N568_9EUKA|nr:hypothetical protein PROFUN_13157 [Planoprotostelium fungivorum]